METVTPSYNTTIVFGTFKKNLFAFFVVALFIYFINLFIHYLRRVTQLAEKANLPCGPPQIIKRTSTKHIHTCTK